MSVFYSSFSEAKKEGGKKKTKHTVESGRVTLHVRPVYFGDWRMWCFLRWFGFGLPVI
jgi:hypothetical protein